MLWFVCFVGLDDLVKFLIRCKQGLNPAGGVVGLKENVANDDEEDIFDEEDSSYTRGLSSILHLVGQAGLTVVQQINQNDFPPSIYDVKMYG